MNASDISKLVKDLFGKRPHSFHCEMHEKSAYKFLTVTIPSTHGYDINAVELPIAKMSLSEDGEPQGLFEFFDTLRDYLEPARQLTQLQKDIEDFSKNITEKVTRFCHKYPDIKDIHFLKQERFGDSGKCLNREIRLEVVV